VEHARARSIATRCSPLVGRGHRLAELRSADSGRAARLGSALRVLDLHLHQLVADLVARARLGGENGVGTMSEPRMYQLIRQESPIEDSTAEIHFRDAGEQAFVVTFG
jgi:hypothetical protein